MYTIAKIRKKALTSESKFMSLKRLLGNIQLKFRLREKTQDP